MKCREAQCFLPEVNFSIDAFVRVFGKDAAYRGVERGILPNL